MNLNVTHSSSTTGIRIERSGNVYIWFWGRNYLLIVEYKLNCNNQSWHNFIYSNALLSVLLSDDTKYGQSSLVAGNLHPSPWFADTANWNCSVARVLMQLQKRRIQRVSGCVLFYPKSFIRSGLESRVRGPGASLILFHKKEIQVKTSRLLYRLFLFVFRAVVFVKYKNK